MGYYVYIYFDPSRELEPFYVGKGKGYRSNHHLRRKDFHPLTHRVQKMKSLGIEPIIERYEDLTEEAALLLEVQLIAQIGRKDLGTGPLLNLTDGGDGTAKLIHKEETKKRMSDSHKGKKFSDETRKKMSEAKLGKKLSEEHKQKMRVPKLNSESKKGQKINRKPMSEEQKRRISESKKNKSNGQKGNKRGPYNKEREDR